MTKLKPISIFVSVIIISLAVGYVLAVWQEPSDVPPEGNVPAPINVGPAAQVKEGSPGTIAAGGFLGQVPGYGIYPDPGAASLIGSSLTITGSTSYLRLPLLTTTHRNAITPATGMMIYNTTAGQFEVYIPNQWSALTGGVPLGQACSSPLTCSSGYCVDSYCCDNACSGQTCQTCGPYSSNGVGYCGWVNNSGQDPREVCGKTGCTTGNCTGTSYACTVYTDNQKHDCGICYACDASGNCTPRTVNYSAATALGCTSAAENCRKCTAGVCGYYTSGVQNCGACKRCNASGACLTYAPINTQETGCTGCYFCNATGSCVWCRWTGSQGGPTGYAYTDSQTCIPSQTGNIGWRAGAPPAGCGSNWAYNNGSGSGSTDYSQICTCN